MFAITGITGKVGGEVARNLLAGNRPVRAVVRDLHKGEAWARRGCDLVRADISDAGALTSAFTGAESVFVLVPPNFDPSPGFHEARATAATLRSALAAARPGESYTCPRSAHRRLNRTCLRSTALSSKCLESCRCRLLFCGQDGSWITVAGISLRRPMTA